MATVSSHILDAVTGGPAAGIRVELLHSADGTGKTPVFDIFADAEGRICEAVDAACADGEYQLVLHSADYFSTSLPQSNQQQSVKTVVVHLVMPDAEKRYHIPVMLSPHSYSVWWSE